MTAPLAGGPMDRQTAVAPGLVPAVPRRGAIHAAEAPLAPDAVAPGLVPAVPRRGAIHAAEAPLAPDAVAPGLVPAVPRDPAARTLSGKSVLVTGGAGFIGSHLVERIVREGPANVAIVDNLFLGRWANLAHVDYPLHRYEQDAADHDAMRRIVEKEQVQVVFDLAVIPLPASLERPRWTVDTNTGIVTVACELLREGRFETLVHFSSSEVYGTAQHVPMDEMHPLAPCTPYAASKAAGDLTVISYVKTFGVDASIVRPFNNYGPRQNGAAYAGIIPIVVQRALRDEPVTIFGDGEQTRDYVFVRDTADAAVAIYGQPSARGTVVNVAGGREITVNRLVEMILDALDIHVPVRHEAPRPGDVRRHCGDITRARELVGFAPRVGWEEGLAETVRWYRDLFAAGEVTRGR